MQLFQDNYARNKPKNVNFYKLILDEITKKLFIFLLRKLDSSIFKVQSSKNFSTVFWSNKSSSLFENSYCAAHEQHFRGVKETIINFYCYQSYTLYRVVLNIMRQINTMSGWLKRGHNNVKKNHRTIYVNEIIEDAIPVIL